MNTSIRKFLWLPIAALFTCLLLGFTAPDLIQQLRQKLSDYSEMFPREQVFVHLSQPAAAPGQTVWFSASITDADTKKFSSRSNLFYLKLLNSTGEIVYRGTYPVQEGKARGSIELPDSLNEGSARLVAYTSWMKNYPTGFYFSRNYPVLTARPDQMYVNLVYADSLYHPGQRLSGEILVHNKMGEPVPGAKVSYTLLIDGKPQFTRSNITTENPVSVQDTLASFNPGQTIGLEVTARKGGKQVSRRWLVPTASTPLRLRFFPEGGNFVQGLSNRIAFEARDPTGRPMEITAALLSDGSPVDTFSTIHQGRGSFEIRPEAGTSYRLKVLKPTLPKQDYPIPSPQQHGYILRAEPTGEDSMRVQVQSTGSGSNQIYLVLNSGTELVWSESIRIDSLYSQTIAVEEFPAGIARLTLFDAEEQPRAERLLFLNPEKRLRVELSTGKTEYRTREKVTLNIRTRDSEGEPVAAHLSLGVYDRNQMPDDLSTRNITSTLLLTSELRGEVQNPDWYFAKKSELRRKALELLMLTQGWRRVSPQQLLQADLQKQDKPDRMEAVSGTVLDQQGEPVSGADVTLLRVGKNFMHRQATTTRQGRFYFRSVKTTGSGSGNMRLSATNQNYRIQLDREYLQKEFDRALAEQVRGVMRPLSIDYFVRQSPDDSANYAVLNPTMRYTNVDQTIRYDEIVITGKRYSEKAIEWLKDKRQSNIQMASISGETLEQSGFNAPTAQGASLKGSTAERIYQLVSQVTTVYSLREDGKLLLRAPSSINAEQGALFIVDGARIGTDAGALGFLDVNDIKEINVYEGSTGGKYAFASGGVVEFITKGGSDVEPEKTGMKPNEAIVRTYYTPVNSFNAPDYSGSGENGGKETQRDLRSTVHWQPQIRTGPDGLARISFYTTDATTTYRIQANGLTETGKPGAVSEKLKIEDCRIPGRINNSSFSIQNSKFKI